MPARWLLTLSNFSGKRVFLGAADCSGMSREDGTLECDDYSDIRRTFISLCRAVTTLNVRPLARLISYVVTLNFNNNMYRPLRVLYRLAHNALYNIMKMAGGWVFFMLWRDCIKFDTKDWSFWDIVRLYNQYQTRGAMNLLFYGLLV